jgi:hypothetical protein
MARFGRVFHPQRIQQWAWSDLNPLIWPRGPLASVVQAARQPAAAENPFLALQCLGSAAISASWVLIRDLRDATLEALFFLNYGGLMHLGIPSATGPEVAPDRTDPRELPMVRKALEAIDRGGFVEAVTLRAKVLSSLVTALPVVAILWAFGVSFPGMWGVLAFVGNFIPYVGSLIALVLPVLLGSSSWSRPGDLWRSWCCSCWCSS